MRYTPTDQPVLIELGRSLAVTVKDQAPAGGGKVTLPIHISRRALSMAIVFVLLCCVFHWASDGIFLTPRNLTLLMRQGAIVSIVAMGVTILIIKGEIDLSIGSAVFLCGVAAAMLQRWYGWDTVPTVFATLGVGLLLGVWQGVWAISLGVPSFVVTLGGLLAFRGVGYYLTDAATLAPMSDAYSALSEGFLPPMATYLVLAAVMALGSIAIVREARSEEAEGRRAGLWPLATRLAAFAAVCAGAAWIFVGYRGIPNAIVWVAVCWAVLWFLMMRTVFGRNAYLIGSNREAARLAGIAINKHLIGGFLLMGGLYAVAATLMTARLSASTPASGLYLELDAIAAAVIGGASLRGGVGTVGGAVVGAALLVTIDNGMSLMNISSFAQMIIKGMVLLLALATDTMLTRRK
jgi:D-xylose transport system permease protein